MRGQEFHGTPHDARLPCIWSRHYIHCISAIQEAGVVCFKSILLHSMSSQKQARLVGCGFLDNLLHAPSVSVVAMAMAEQAHTQKSAHHQAVPRPVGGLQHTL